MKPNKKIIYIGILQLMLIKLFVKLTYAWLLKRPNDMNIRMAYMGLSGILSNYYFTTNRKKRNKLKVRLSLDRGGHFKLLSYAITNRLIDLSQLHQRTMKKSYI